MKGLKLAFIMIGMVFLTGCWDYKEIQDRGYVLGIAIDKVPPLPKGFEPESEYLSERELEKMPLQQEKPTYAYTIQIPIVAHAKNQPVGAGGGGSDKEGSWDLTIEGYSAMEANRQFSTRINYPPFYEHMQVIVISEIVAKEGVGKVLDFFLRDHEMRRRTRVFVTPGSAKKILDVEPRIDDYPAIYLAQLPLNADKTSRILHKTDLGEMSQSIHGGVDFALPRIIATKDEIKNAGCAVFKGDKMVGWLGELDTVYTKWIRDGVLGGVIVVPMPGKEKGVATLEIFKAKTKTRPKVEGGQIKMDIQVKATFSFAEETGTLGENILDENLIEALEKEAEKYLKENMEDTIRYVQKEFGADIFHFRLVLEQYDPKTWEEIKDQWEDIFPQIEPVITVEAKISQIGTTK